MTPSRGVPPWLARLVRFQPGEVTTASLMFAYSFLAMTAYNIIKPITRSKFISALGADNLPYVLLAAAVLIGVIMHGYSLAIARLPRRLILPVTQSVLVGLLVIFWGLFRAGGNWVPVAFYVFGLVLGVLLISQFWTLANDIYDSRQARRLFGFIGGGASLGAALGSGLTAFAVEEVGTDNLLLVSAATLALCAALVTFIVRRQTLSADFAGAVDERGVGSAEAIGLLRSSRHLQVIAAVIGLAAIGANIIEMQLNLATEEVKGAGGEDAIAAFLGEVTFYLSLAGFAIQVFLTSRIHRSAGLIVALMLLPVTLGLSAVVILLSGALWAPAVARVLDTSLRYTVDKTTREILFLPLPSDLKYRAKPFVDVTMDRLSKAVGALLVLVLIKPWGAGLDWHQLSFASFAIMGVWFAAAFAARREYLRSFRRSIGRRDVEPAAVRMDVVDAATLGTLVDALRGPDDASVLYAMDVLEKLDKRHLLPPALLEHASPAVRARALAALPHMQPLDARAPRPWTVVVDRLLEDHDAGVRAAAVRALVAIRRREIADLLQGYLDDADPRVSLAAAVELAGSNRPEDVRVAEAAFARVVADTRAEAASGRREAAAALGGIRHPTFHTFLVPLLHDPDAGVARQALESARALGARDLMFVPAYVALLGHRTLKRAAREALVAHGEAAIDVLAYFLADPDEQIWVRRHVPATLAALPSQRSADALVAALGDPDGFLRYKALEALGILRRTRPDLSLPTARIERLLGSESARYYTYLSLRHTLVAQDPRAASSLVVRALDDKLARTLDRVYRLLALLYPWQDVAAARYSIERGDAAARARGIEYLDTMLGGSIRKKVLPLFDESPVAEKVHRAHAVLRSRPRDLADTLAQLVHEDDDVVAASAIHFVAGRGVRTLDDDLVFVLAHRTALRPLAAEAAGASLAGRAPDAGPDDGAALLTTAGLADRLRAIPLFEFVSVDEVFRIAAKGRQARSGRGAPIVVEGAPASEVIFLINGTVTETGGGRPDETVSAPAAIGFEDAIDGRTHRRSVTAATAVLCFRLVARDFLDMLSENSALSQGVFRMLLTRPVAGPVDAALTAPAGAAPEAPAGALEAVDKATRLRRNPLLAKASVEQLVALVAVARDVPLTAGAELFGNGGPASVYHVLQGEVRLEASGAAPIVAGPGATIGVAETLAGLPPAGRAVVTGSGHALRLDRDDLFAVLADHVDLLQGVFSGVLAASRAAGPR